MYYVIGGDGNQYGPVDMTTLNMWATEGRVTPDSTIKDSVTGMEKRLGSEPGFSYVPPASLPPIHAATPVDPYPRQNYSVAPMGYAPVRPSNSLFWWCIGEAIAGPIVRIGIGGWGFFFSGYAVYYAFRLKAANHPWWVIGMVASWLSLLLVLGSFAFQLGGSR